MGRRLFKTLGGDVNAYGAQNEDSLLLSSLVSNDSTNYSYACVGVEKIMC